MRLTAARPSSGRIAVAVAVVAWLAVLPAAAQTSPAATPSPATKRLLVLPTDDVAVPTPVPSGATLTSAEAAAFPLGLQLGMSPKDVNLRLAHRLPSVAPAALAVVPYLGPAEVDSFAIGMEDAGNLKPAITSCFGPDSQIVFMFIAAKLYTISFRFAHGPGCPDADGAADDVYQRLLAIPQDAMPSEHYRVGGIDVVDAWDAKVESVVRRRWRAQ